MSLICIIDNFKNAVYLIKEFGLLEVLESDLKQCTDNCLGIKL